MEYDIDDKIKNSFIKVREDISSLRKEIETLKNTLLLKNNEILALKNRFDARDELISRLRERLDTLSTGNLGVNNDQQSLIMINNDDQRSPIKPITVEGFRRLTDREFSIFLAIYQLEEEKGAATYEDIAKQLGLTVVNVRVYVTGLINMGYPLYGERLFNRRTKFRISKEFREQNLMSGVLTLRELKTIKHKPSSSSVKV